jgi:hypothetical protein
VGDGVGLGVGEGVGLGVGDGVGLGVGDGVGLGVGEGVGLGVGDGVGLGVGVAQLVGGTGAVICRLSPVSNGFRFQPPNSGCQVYMSTCPPKAPDNIPVLPWLRSNKLYPPSIPNHM